MSIRDPDVAMHRERAGEHFKRAAAERALAASAALPNIRDRHLRAAEAWEEMGRGLKLTLGFAQVNEAAGRRPVKR
jgi:hypothetical protein